MRWEGARRGVGHKPQDLCGYRVGGLVLPTAQHRPAGLGEAAIGVAVAPLVTFDLRQPVSGVGAGPR